MAKSDINQNRPPRLPKYKLPLSRFSKSFLSKGQVCFSPRVWKPQDRKSGSSTPVDSALKGSADCPPITIIITITPPTPLRYTSFQENTVGLHKQCHSEPATECLRAEPEQSGFFAVEPSLQPRFPSQRQSLLGKLNNIGLKSQLRLKKSPSIASIKSTVSTRSLLTLGKPSTVSASVEPALPRPFFPRKRSASCPQLESPISLADLHDELLSDNGSAKVRALDCTRRLRGRTATVESGGFSDVSKAKLDGQLVAVKALRVTRADQLDVVRMRKRLGREFHVWANLKHPNVLELRGYAFIEKWRPCLISPWCHYGTLQDYLGVYPTLDPQSRPDRKDLVLQIAQGLSYLHSRSVVHGDFKTGNVLITREHVVKISDFGGSRILGVEYAGFSTGSLSSGTIRYSAPEVSFNNAPQTQQSDVFSFGYVALETVTGKYPFWNIQHDIAVLQKVAVEGKIPPRDDYTELKDEAMWELLRWCWEYDPSTRPSMFQVCKSLREIQASWLA